MDLNKRSLIIIEGKFDASTISYLKSHETMTPVVCLMI